MRLHTEHMINSWITMDALPLNTHLKSEQEKKVMVGDINMQNKCEEYIVLCIILCDGGI